MPTISLVRKLLFRRFSAKAATRLSYGITCCKNSFRSLAKVGCPLSYHFVASCHRGMMEPAANSPSRPRAEPEKNQATRTSTSFMISDILDSAPRPSRESSSEDSERYSSHYGREDSPSDQGSEAGGDPADGLENDCEKLDEHG